ncbi:MAG TPA: chemotaxis protein CheB [Polyangiaceae bacterium]|nr:chemotaxis protein CheB [Polyangiaceae bacterium]
MEKTELPSHPLPTRVVGIGASAGGLDPLERFFGALPKRTDMAFVVVQHLSPDFKSLMDELLARHTDLPICLVEDGMPVLPDHIYLIPSKKEMIISSGRLLLSERDRDQELTLPIDVFFRSLAQDCGPRSAAVVLSGGGSDGSRSLRDVHEAGGLVIVQSVETAQFDGMPKSAIDTGLADWVLAPEAMPQVLVDCAEKGEEEDASASSDERREARGLAIVHQMLQDEFGIDFTDYKPSTVTRRIERRLALAHSQDIEEYIKRLKLDRDELDVLYRDLLIGVTRFFRDESAFALIEKVVLPELLQRMPKDAPVRLWVAGCATGEEAYSLSIVLSDLMDKVGRRDVKIFATDVHRGSLERAARAIYDEPTLANVSAERRERYFLRIGDTYQIVPDLRQMIVFAQHNVIKDAPFTRIDFVSCRNLLIYFQPPAQQKVLSFFHFALNRGGVLFLGPSESASPFARDFDVVDKQWQLYRKHSDARMPVETRIQTIARPDGRSGPAPLPPAAARYSLSQLLGTYDAVLDEVMPPSFLVSDRGELIHAFAGASRFLKLKDGRLGLDILELVDAELKMVLMGGLKRALTEPSAIVFKGVRVRDAATEAVYKVTVRRVGSKMGAAHLLVSIESMQGAAREPRKETEVDLDQISRERFAALELELSSTKESLQASIEERGASNEELQASNEELQASNEELQSTNEELQSVNEELYSVNAEYQRKIAELTELTNDMDNLLSSTDVGTIFLDRELKIRKFTPQIADTFNLVSHDIGRPIDTFAHRLDHPELVDDLKRVLVSSKRVERELREVHGKAFFLRILPYRVKGTVEGVVLTLIDVSGLKAAEDALFHERYLLNSLLATIPDAIYFKDARGKFIRANLGMAARLGLDDPSEAVGKTALDLPDSEAALALHRQDEHVLKTGEAQHYQLERRISREGTEVWDLVTRLPLRDKKDEVVGIIGIFRDVTEQQRAERKIEDAVRRRDQFLAMLSHELRNPLGAIVTATSLLKADNSPRLKPARLMEIVDRQSQQMARLLDDLLEVSRVTQDKIELKKEVVDLRTITADAADAVRAQLESLGIQFSVDLDAELLPVDGDPARLQQIQVNLLTNASKYTPSGGQVQLAVRREGDHAVIRVRDDGMGIAPDILDSVFELFVQSARTIDRAAGGLGVGLTLVRALVKMHGGTVTAHSDGEGKGSEFVVRLPITAPRAVEDSASERPRPHLAEGARIVVVEDNRDSREMLCELMEQAGFHCRTAENGREALDLIEEVRPQIAILDLGLPEIDGFEVARRIRANPKLVGMWLIALTGYGQASDRLTGQEVGFDEHLVKPVDTDELLRLLEEMRNVNTRKPKRAGQASLHSVSGSFGNGRGTKQPTTAESDD